MNPAPASTDSGQPGRARLVVIFNPVAGLRRRRRLEATLAPLRVLGCTITLRETQGPRHAEALARALRPGDGDVVVAAGGDGTINEVVNGLMASAAPGAALPLAIIPLGTANVLAAELGLDPDPARIARTICGGAIRTVSLGRAGARRFTMMVGAGFDAQVVAGVDTALKRRIGKAAYVWEAARQLRRFGFPSHRVTLDGTAHETASVIVANGRFYGGRFVCAPSARLEDPEFQVCLFTRRGARNVLRYALAMGLGRLTSLPDVEVVPAREVVIEGPEGDPLQGDGDVIGRLPVEISIEPDVLRLVAPA